MIVDLLRNDLGRVCRYGSVRVEALCRLESFRYVHHLVSEVRGQLRPACDLIDLLRAAFPGGSVTGAPKVRAMEIIAELEPSPAALTAAAWAISASTAAWTRTCSSAPSRTARAGCRFPSAAASSPIRSRSASMMKPGTRRRACCARSHDPRRHRYHDFSRRDNQRRPDGPARRGEHGPFRAAAVPHGPNVSQPLRSRRGRAARDRRRSAAGPGSGRPGRSAARRRTRRAHPRLHPARCLPVLRVSRPGHRRP